MTKIAICGACGKMGRFIYDVMSERDDCTVSAGIDKFGEAYADFPVVKEPADLPEKPDVIIDFSHPSALDGLLSYCLSNGTALVIATTGYTEEDTAKIHKASEQIPVFFTFNMTLGINLLANLAKTAAKVLGGQYDIEIIEKHHNQKIDAPSGTAIMLADAINEELDNKYHYVYDRHSVRAKREKTEIGMHSVRGGTIASSGTYPPKQVFSKRSIRPPSSTPRLLTRYSLIISGVYPDSLSLEAMVKSLTTRL